MKKRLQAVFSGTVQGVGFRFTTERLAVRYPVTGYVKNLADGRVEVVAEGEEDCVREFMKAVRESSMQSYIRKVDAGWSEAEGGFTNFKIAY